MYKETLAESSPLYGRASAQILLTPMRYSYLADFIPDCNQEKLVELYSLCGGVPRYIELVQSFNDFWDALTSLVLDRNGILYNEAKYLLHEEIHTPNTCWSILNALGSGTNRISELGSRLNLPANQLTRYIDLLKDLFLIYREVPVLEKNPLKSKKGLYQICDPFLQLGFGSIYPYESFLEFGEPSKVIEKLRPQINHHIELCFERICREYVATRLLDYNCIRVGRQWSKNYEIDIAAVNAQNELAIVGECKWSTKKVGLSVLKQLKTAVKENKLPIAKNCQFMLFSKSGFSDELSELSQSDLSIVLVSDMF